MAKNDPVEKPSDPNGFKTTFTCPGCGEEVNLLNPHLLAMVKPQRAVIEAVNTALLDAETDDEGNIVKLSRDLSVAPDTLDEETSYYLGYKKGAGDLIYLHNYECLADWSKEQISDNQTEHGSPILRTLKDDPVVYGEGE